MPCAPFGGSGMGFFALPTVGAGVWIEFEHGDPDYPDLVRLLVGLGGRDAARPAGAALQEADDRAPRAATASCWTTRPASAASRWRPSGGQKIMLSALGIEIDNGMGASIKLTGPQVSINSGALEVT